MKLDIDQIIQLTDAWEFEVSVGGMTYATRRPTVAELSAMQNIRSLSPVSVAALAESLFVDQGQPVPDVKSWNVYQLTSFLIGYLEFFRQRSDSEKKFAAVAAASRAAVSQQQAAVVGAAAAEGVPR